jgi:uncharacterized protein with ParB-like and HNH nuclease domain
MSYKSDTIAAVIKRLNTQYFLPAIQREFVWDTGKIISLYDSIMRAYPISSFLFWELAPENKDKWEVYKFVEHASDGGKHNELAGTDGVNDLTLVLDGQQRLTSLLVGLKGTYEVKMKYKRWDDPSAWVTRRLYINLLKDPRTSEEDGEIGIHYEFRFAEDKPENLDGQYWFKVGHILNFDDEDRFYEFVHEERDKLPDSVTKGQIGIFERNLGRLWRAIWKDDFISYYMENDQEYDRVLDIFVRANEGGTKLSKSDLLLSMIISKWVGMNAREEIHGFVDRINNELTRKNDFSKDFVMKSCLVLSDLSVAYKVDNFTDKNLSLIESKWKEIKHAIEKGVDLVNSFGIDRDTLTSVNALIPLIYYIFQHPQANLQGNTPEEVRNRTAIRRWFTMALLNNVFGGSSDSILTELRRVLKEHSTEPYFPLDALNKEIGRAGRTAYFDAYAIDNFLSITYGKRIIFLALSLLYDDNNWGTKSFHQDHIFPRALFDKTMEDSGFNTEILVKYYVLKDRIGNLELLLSHENQEKSSQPFEQWISTRDSSFKQRHLIPDDPELWKFQNFEHFIKRREEMIEDRLKQLFGPPDKEE